MQEAESWEVVPSLDTIQQVMSEVDDPSKVILHVYFRQPYVLDEDSGLRDAGAILAGFGMTDSALLDVLSGDYAPQGRMPFALAGTRQAIIEQDTDRPGYDETTDGALYPFGYGLTYEDADDGEEPTTPEPEPTTPAPDPTTPDDGDDGAGTTPPADDDGTAPPAGTADPEAPGGDLAQTGAPVIVLGLVAAAVLLLGTALVLQRRFARTKV